MRKPNTGAVPVCHVTCCVNQPDRTGTAVDCADDIADVLESLGNDRLRVRGGPHRTRRIVEHLRRNGTQQKPTKFASPVGGHYNEVDLMLVHILCDSMRGISNFNSAYHLESFEFLAPEALQFRDA